MRSAWFRTHHSSAWRLGAVMLLAVAFAFSAVITNSGYAADVDYPFAAVQATGTYSNTTAITWAVNSGPGAPSPSNIDVSGLTGNITNVTVTLNGVSHSRPDDFDIMLQGPTGAAILLWSDACGGESIANLTMTFADSGGALPDTTDATTGPCVSGTYSPSNYNGAGSATVPNEDQPDGVAATITTLAGFNGTNPNGTWSLRSLDDRSGNFGSIGGGWSITITTANLPPIVDPIGDMTLAPDSSATVQINASDPDGGTLAYQVTSSNSAVADVAVNATGLIDIQTGTTGSATITVTVSDGQGGSTVETFIVTVEEAPPVNQPPVIDAIGDQAMTTGETRNLTLSATDPDGDPVTFGATSGDTGVVTVSVSGNTLTLNAVAAGSAVITVTASDGTNDATPVTFTVTVTDAPPVNQPPVIDAIGDQAMTTGETRNLTLSATDPDGDPVTFGATSGDTGVVTVSVSGNTLTLNAVAAGSAVITVTASDGTNDATPVTFTVTVTEGEVPTPTEVPTEVPTQPAPVPAAHYAMEPAQLCADPTGLTNPIVRASVAPGTVPNGNVYCRVLAEDGAFPNPLDSARLGDPGLVQYGVIHAVDIFGVTAGGLSYPDFEIPVTVCLEGTGRFIYLNALNAPRTTFEMPSVVQGGFTCATIPAAGTVVLIPALP